MKNRGGEMMRWGVLWRSENLLDGVIEHIMGDGEMPLLFRTRADARTFIEKHYGYIAHRPDLQAEPHGWKMPKAVRVKIEAAERGQDVTTG